MHRLTRTIGSACARRPLRTLAVWAAVAVAVVALAATAGGRFVDDFVAPGSQSDRAMRLLDERFPEASGGSAMVVFAADPGHRLEPRRPAIAATLAAAEKVPHVASVADPFAAGTVSADGRVGYATVTFDQPALDLGPAPFTALADALAARADGLAAELGGD
jgi:RND superfamily putative drug exporter